MDKKLPTPTNQQDFFKDETYVVPPPKTRPDWDTSFVRAVDDVRLSRPILVLNRDDRNIGTIDRIERFRKLAAGKTSNVTTCEFRDASMVQKSEWREEMDRKFHRVASTGVKISPRSQSINKDIKQILKLEKLRQMKQADKIKEWENEVVRERTEKIIERKRRTKNKEKNKDFIL